jgi:UDP-2,3-diacylglucosamine pyrophosphatase LpxH
MKTYRVVSDTHLGSRHCRAQALLRFLDGLPADATLVLNGDVLDHWRPLPPAHAAVLDRLRRESARGREIVWIHGNNDADYRLPQAESIRMASCLELPIAGGVYIAHGHVFDRILHGNRLLTLPFRVLHGARRLVGAPSVHAAQYARRWHALYGLFKNRMARQAARYACAQGLTTVVCGHTHYAEEQWLEGVHYLNSGCWTEDRSFYVEISAEGAWLKPFCDDNPAHAEK